MASNGWTPMILSMKVRLASGQTMSFMVVRSSTFLTSVQIPNSLGHLDDIIAEIHRHAQFLLGMYSILLVEREIVQPGLVAYPGCLKVDGFQNQAYEGTQILNLVLGGENNFLGRAIAQRFPDLVLGDVIGHFGLTDLLVFLWQYWD